MAKTLAQFLTLMADEIGDDGSDTNNTSYLNMAARDIWRYGSWPETTARAFVNTQAAIDTGTVDLVNGDATVTKAAGTPDFTSPTVAGAKFATGYSRPWYRIDTVTDADNFELAEPYIGTSVSGTAYVIYNDVLTLASDLETIRDMWIHDESRSYRLNIVPERQVEHLTHYPRQAERPYFAAIVENSSGGARQVRVGPYAPDQVYRVEYKYSKSYTDMSLTTDTTGLDAALDDAVLELALSMAYRRDHFRRSQSMRQTAYQLVREEWQRNRPAEEITYLVERRDLMPGRDAPYDVNDLEIP